MSKLDEMLKRMCPRGVEYRTLGDVCEMKRGVRVVKTQLSQENGYRVYQNSMTPLGYYDKANC